jgi:hypothetical protein
MALRSNIDEFIKESKLRFGNKFDYSKTIYINNRTPLTLTCNILDKNNIKHGEFNQKPYTHLLENSDGGCKKCLHIKLSIIQRSNINEFIRKAKLLYDNKYNYSLIKEYINSRTKIIIKCNKCNNIFKQTPHDHLSGRECPKCSMENSKNNKKYNINKFIKLSRLKHGNKYKYNKSVYINSKTPLIISCDKKENNIEHGDFWQKPCAHIRGDGCPKCSNNYKLTTQQVIERAIKVHGNKYNYSKVNYINCNTKIKIKCNKCGNIFKQIFYVHVLMRCGCPKCNISHGEAFIEKWLKENNINYIWQHTYDDCRGKKNKLPFDFYLPDCNTLIEFDGWQHYRKTPYMMKYKIKDPIAFFNKIQHNDSIKTKYCIDNGINLIRIPQSDIKKIDNILTEKLLLKKAA